jgi:lysophospholipase L1-like esterase
MKYTKILLFILSILIVGCSSDNKVISNSTTIKNINYLALGDSYTIGQSVCETCRFPIQLQDSLKKYLHSNVVFTTNIIATTGWTTTNLKEAIATQNPSSNYNLVTLLIGVNNQYQNKPFSIYEQEFPELVTTAIIKAKGNKNNVIVVSIPDYAYTPFGQGAVNISNGVLQYNTFAQNYCTQNNIKFVYITDITQLGLQQPNLVANDGLHPSSIAYSKFVERILPFAKEILTE